MSESPVTGRPGQGIVTSEPLSQVRVLTRLIQREPETPVYYVLRGEEFLARGHIAQARADFETAQRLAETLAAQSDWGYLYQAYGDRAAAGLRCCGADD